MGSISVPDIWPRLSLWPHIQGHFAWASVILLLFAEIGGPEPLPTFHILLKGIHDVFNSFMPQEI